MLTLLFANIGYALTCLVSFSVLMCFATTTWTGLKTALVLLLTASLGWAETWYNPTMMFIAHFWLLSVAMLILTGGIAEKLLLSLLAMLIADAVFVVWLASTFGEINAQRLFWWRSALNAIFIYQCLIVLTGAKNGLLGGFSGTKERKNGILARIVARSHKSA